ncbi:hypothetical protein LCGC14_2582820 [marine sediment metagenome]|uniref:Uncharacterized protein n=1 Tax=marine sediment metagenome TaxID=412755 RepID=A0A0F9D6Q7_9ZZZZ
MNVPQFVDHVVMLMRGEGYEREGWDENCIRVAVKGTDSIVVEFEDGSEFELTARPTTTDLRQAGVRYWLAVLLDRLKSEKAKTVVRNAEIEKPND